MHPEEALQLKVMRLTRRCSVASSLLESIGPNVLAQMDGVSADITTAPLSLVLPSSGLDVYCGEEFIAYLYISNEAPAGSGMSVFGASVAAELDGLSQRVQSDSFDELRPSESFECSAGFTLPMEARVVTLSVSLNFQVSRFSEVKTLRRSYKLNLTEALSVTVRWVGGVRGGPGVAGGGQPTEFHEDLETAALEICISSNLRVPLTLQSARFIENGWVEATDLKRQEQAVSLQPIISQKNYKPQINRIFYLSKSLETADVSAGMVQLKWVLPQSGSQGKLELAVAAPEIEKKFIVRVLNRGNGMIVTVGKSFILDLEISSYDATVADIWIQIDFQKLSPLLIQGTSKRKTDQGRISLEMFAAERGFIKMQGISCRTTDQLEWVDCGIFGELLAM